MRKRVYEDGSYGFALNLPYESIPDNYEIKSCLNNGYDLSYVSVMKMLFEKYKNKTFESAYELGIEFQNKDWCRQEIIKNQAFAFLESAIYLCTGVNSERDGETISNYVIPCAYCCRQAMELFLKYCALVKGIETKKLICHKLVKLWNIVDEKYIPNYDKLTNYIQELDTIDENGMALRYGLDKSFDIPKENFEFNIDIMIHNSMYLINVLEEYVICKYKHRD